MTTTFTTLPREIVYEREAREYRATLDGELIGYYPSYLKAEEALDDAAYNLLIDTAPIARCTDCQSALGDLGFCEECAERAPVPLNTDDTPLTAAWRAYKAGAMDWSDVQAIQASLMPRCADHDRPAAIFLDKRPACPACLDEAEQLAA